MSRVRKLWATLEAAPGALPTCPALGIVSSFEGHPSFKNMLSVEWWVFSPGMNPTSFPRDWNSTLEISQRLSRATLLPWTSDEMLTCWFTWHRDTPELSQIFSFSCSKLRSWIFGVDPSHIDIIEIRSILYKRKSAINSFYRYRHSNEQQIYRYRNSNWLHHPWANHSHLSSLLAFHPS